MIRGENPGASTPEFNYHLLRNALNRFGKNPGRLTEAEFRQAFRQAGKSYELESLVLSSSEARVMIIDEGELDRAMIEVVSRYADTEEFARDLQANGMDEASLRQALYRELLFNGVMQKVAANSAAVNELDVRLFYEMHRDRFEVPERRLARHILITVNLNFPENTPVAARARMRELVEKLDRRSNRFASFAKRYSECPTALEGGLLGEVSRGQLYPELDALLFTLREQQISPIVESEMGLHILLCERIRPGRRVALSQAAPRIREILQERQRRNCQKAWLAGLKTDASSRVGGCDKSA